MLKSICKGTNANWHYILILLMILVAAPLNAQRSHLGLMGGFVGATIKGSYIEDSNSLEMGFHGMLTLDREFNDRWSLETGISWMQKGGKKLALTGVSDTSGTTYGFQSSYIQLPVMLRAKFPIAGGPWHIVPFAGIAIGTQAGCKHKKGDKFEFEEDPCDENSPGGKPKTLEFSIPLGSYVWIEFPGGSRFRLGLKYEIGLTNIFTAAQEANLKARNNALVLMFGFSGPLQ